MTDPRGRPPRPGEHVEVYNAFTDGWSRGFVIAEATDEGYRIRRMSDHAVLPAVFPTSAVRRATD